MKPNQTVKFSQKFKDRVGDTSINHRRGVVVGVKRIEYIQVQWDTGQTTSHLSHNLKVVEDV